MIPALPGSNGKDGQTVSVQLNKDPEAFLAWIRKWRKETTLREKGRKRECTENGDGHEGQIFNRTFQLREERRSRKEIRETASKRWPWTDWEAGEGCSHGKVRLQGPDGAFQFIRGSSVLCVETRLLPSWGPAGPGGSEASQDMAPDRWWPNSDVFLPWSKHLLVTKGTWAKPWMKLVFLFWSVTSGALLMLERLPFPGLAYKARLSYANQWIPSPHPTPPPLSSSHTLGHCSSAPTNPAPGTRQPQMAPTPQRPMR